MLQPQSIGTFENDILVDGYDVTTNGGRFARDGTATGGIRHVENPDRDACLVLTGGLDVDGTTVTDDSGATLIMDNVRFRLTYSLIGVIGHADADMMVRGGDGDGKGLRTDGVTVSDPVIDDSDIVMATQNGGSWHRVVWNDILGGGPRCGVDLSSVTGQEDGQQARSDGTATDFPTGTLATWNDANIQWIRADGQATM